MRITVLQTNNNVKGLKARFEYIEKLIARIPDPEFVILPELSSCSYIPNQNVWKYKESFGCRTKSWAHDMARKYHCYISAGYVETDGHDIYNSYLIANESGVLGTVRKIEGESNIFKRENFGSTIDTPLGTIGVAICFDSHRKCFYDNIEDQSPVLILMPHAWATNDKYSAPHLEKIDHLGQTYANCFGCPVIFANALGDVEPMPGITGHMMNPKTFKLNGNSVIYEKGKSPIRMGTEESLTCDVQIKSDKSKCIEFYNGWIDKDNALFRRFILPFDVKRGTRLYEQNKQP